MSKIEVLQINQVLRQRIGIYSWNLTDPSHNFFKSVSTYWLLFFLIFGFLISSSLFVVTNSAQVSMQLQTTTIVIAGLQCFGMFFGIGFNEKKVKDLHNKLQQIVNEVDNNKVTGSYLSIEEKCKKYTSMISRYTHCEQFIYLSSLIKSLVRLCMGDLDASQWNLPYNLVVPFDKTIIFNWYLLWFFQCNMGFTYASSMVPVTSYFVCCCLYIRGLCNHFKILMQNTQFDAGEYQNATNPSKRNHFYLSLQNSIFKVVEVQANLFEIFNLTAEINSATIFALLPINALFLALTMYNTENSDFDAVTISFNILCVICLTWPFLFCFFATTTTNQILNIGNEVYFSNWYNYPPAMRKCFGLIIQRSQKNVEFTGLGLIYCTTVTFGKLFQKACSYYLIFRSLAQL